MRDAFVLSELRAALRRNGVWGARAERLMQEWADHVREDAARRAEKGLEPEAARDAAWSALGVPKVLAASAARELAKGSWLGRHPWLGGAALPALGWIASIAVVVGVPALIASLLTGRDYVDSSKFYGALVCWEQAVNWIPWILSIAWLGRIAARMPGGWKLYWITAVALTLCAPAAKMVVYPPVHGPHTGFLIVNITCGIPGAISSTIQHVLNHLPLVGPRFQDWVEKVRNLDPLEVHGPPQTVAWIQTAIMLFGILAFHFKARARSGAIAAVQPT